MKQFLASRGPRRRGLVGAVLAIGAIPLAFAAGAHLGGGTPATPAPAPSADPRLVLRAREVPITGTLAGRALRGSLYPGFPGTNTLRIAVPGSAPEGRAADIPLTLVAVMPGMRMVPATAHLRWGDGAYRGVIALPMFGTYRARLALGSGTPPQRGTARLSLPLTLGT